MWKISAQAEASCEQLKAELCEQQCPSTGLLGSAAIKLPLLEPSPLPMAASRLTRAFCICCLVKALLLLLPTSANWQRLGKPPGQRREELRLAAGNCQTWVTFLAVPPASCMTWGWLRAKLCVPQSPHCAQGQGWFHFPSSAGTAGTAEQVCPALVMPCTNPLQLPNRREKLDS